MIVETEDALVAAVREFCSSWYGATGPDVEAACMSLAYIRDRDTPINGTVQVGFTFRRMLELLTDADTCRPIRFRLPPPAAVPVTLS